MSNIAIRVENLGKMYRIGHAQQRHDTLRDALVDGLWPRIERIIRINNSRNSCNSWQEDTIWALKDVSFEVQRGEVVGIIGRNGAGKSTLLKILSRITEPTEGRVEMYGRVGSLLEVGTGFHPELTGRENIYLSGAILGMKKAEIDRRFDEIVAFAEIEKFLDTPVKRYSSGMYVRLAFAVAAHLEPEILLVDEVLAVGDAAFQKKCLGKMGDVAHEGRTVLFVSHNMRAITSLCAYTGLLAQGHLDSFGSTESVVARYLKDSSQMIARGHTSFNPSPELPFVILSMCTQDEHDQQNDVLRREERITIVIKGEVRVSGMDYHVYVEVRTADDLLLFRTHSFEQPKRFELFRTRGSFTLTCTLPPNLLPASSYRLGVSSAISGKRELQRYYPALEFDVIQEELLGGMFMHISGLLTPECEWSVSYDTGK